MTLPNSVAAQAPLIDTEPSPFESQYWYAGSISERKCEEVLSKTGRPGAFLVRDNILPGADYNYVLSVYSETKISHFDVKVFATDECEFNGYKFTSLPEAITFYTENRLCGHYLDLPGKPVVSEKTRKGAAPVITVAPPAPPTRSTPLQDRIVRQQCPTGNTSSQPPSYSRPIEWGLSSSGEISNKGGSPQFSNVKDIVLRMGSPNSSQDDPDDVPDEDNRSSTPVKSRMSHDTMLDHKTCDDQIVAQGHVRDSSDICETSFDDVTSSTVGSEADKTEANAHSPLSPSKSTPELQSVTTKAKVAPPVPLRRSSTRTSAHDSHENPSATTSKAQTCSELKRLPSLKDRKEQLQAQMTASSNPPPSPSSSEDTQPGRVVIHEALKGVSPGMPATQHPLLRKKREDTTMTEKEEQEKLSREENEKAKKRFSFKGSKSKKGKGADPQTTNSRTDLPPSKEQRRYSMPVSEQDELQNMFKHITQHRLSNPDPLPQIQTKAREREGDDEEKRLVKNETTGVETKTEIEEAGNVGLQAVSSSLPQEPLTKPSNFPPHSQLKSLPEHPMETQLASVTGSHSNTLERCTPKPPSSSPPSLPGSIDRRILRQGNSQNNTLERQNRPGSRPGTLERKTPPPPTSQPPPAPTEIRKDLAKPSRTPGASIGFSGGRVDLVDVIVGVDRDILTKTQSPSVSATYSYTPHQSGPINVKRKSMVRKRY